MRLTEKQYCPKKQIGNDLWKSNGHVTDDVTLSHERQSARMSKITNDGLTRSGTGCLITVLSHMATVGVAVKGLIACGNQISLTLTEFSLHSGVWLDDLEGEGRWALLGVGRWERASGVDTSLCGRAGTGPGRPAAREVLVGTINLPRRGGGDLPARRRVFPTVVSCVADRLIRRRTRYHHHRRQMRRITQSLQPWLL